MILPEKVSILIGIDTFLIRMGVIIATTYNKTMTCTDHYSSIIRSAGFRFTNQRRAIMDTLAHAGGHMTPAALFERVRNDYPDITEPTIYRNLEFLCQQGWVRATHTGGGHLEYEIAGDEHHHLVCSTCGAHQMLSHAQVHLFYQQVESATGYRLDDRHLTLKGLCTHCKGV